MKKLLSLILAMMLVVGMLPVAFASTSTDPIEYEIGHRSLLTAPTAEYLSKAAAITASNSYDLMDSSKTDLWAYNTSTQGSSENRLYANYIKMAFSSGRLTVAATGHTNAYLALKLKVENPGWYDLSFLASQYQYGPDLKVYFGRSNNASLTLAPANSKYLVTPLTKELTTYLADATDTTPNHKYDVGKVYIDQADDYYILFVGYESAGGLAGGSQDFYLNQVTLTPTPPDSIAGLPASITVDEEATSDAITATVKDANGVALEGAEVTYSIDNAAVATVDAATGAVTGVKKGTATVTATVTGYNVTATIPVTVNGEEEPPVEPDDAIKYIINTTVLSDEAIDTATSEGTLTNGTLTKDGFIGKTVDGVVKATRLTYDSMKSETKWEPNNIYYSAGSFNMTKDRIMIGTSEASINDGNAYLNLKLKVENPGWYDLSVLVGENAYGAGADIYLGGVNRATWAPVYAYELNKIGHIKTQNDSANNSKFDCEREVGKVYIPEAGDYFIAFIFTNGGNTNTSNSRQFFYLSQITLDPTTAPVVESATKTFEDDTVTVKVEGYETIVGIDNPEVVNQVAIGTDITVTAAETKDGKAFAGWKRGSADNGVFVTTDLSYSFTTFTNYVLTAVYEDAEEVEEGTVNVEFYKQDGTYVSKTPVAVGTAGADVSAPSTSLIGHSFDGWYVGEGALLSDVETITKLTRAVATFTANSVDGSLLYNGKTQSSTYGAKIFDTVPGATFWMRDGKVIAYGDTYEFYRWGAGNIVACTGDVDVKPVVYLDDDTVDGAYMIEYDKGNSTRVVEAGIIFSSSATSTVDGYNGERFVSQRNGDHGQLAAAPNGTHAYARGYLIYETASGYEVIYTDSVAMN